MSSWLQHHLTTFVAPYLDYMPKRLPPNTFFAVEEYSVIKNAWRSMKSYARGQEILLPGRDVFIFEVLARREGYPTRFVPECSRQTVRYLKHLKGLLLDTGFMGSIPLQLEIERFQLLSYAYNRQDRYKQIFPGHKGSRGLALKIEDTPKYWLSGRMINGVVHQEYSPLEQFERAAQLTIEVYTNSAPSFMERDGYVWKASKQKHADELKERLAQERLNTELKKLATGSISIE